MELILVEPTVTEIIEPVASPPFEIDVLKGRPGDAGPPNTLSIGTVTTGAAGSSASAILTGIAPSQVLSLVIPRGDTGSGGIADGYITDIKISAAAAIDPTKIAGTAVITSDARLSNARTPTAHKSTHAIGGTDVLTPTDIGLGNVNNTSDAAKPISTATQTALDLKAPLASPTFTGTVSGITKSMVGLGNVDNTSDVNKPISTAVQNALNLKVDSSALNESVQDMLSTFIVAGSNITLTYNDAGNTLTVASTASGSGDALKSQTLGVRNRIDASTWEPRPTGYNRVMTIGADPSPVDMQDGDIRMLTP